MTLLFLNSALAGEATYPSHGRKALDDITLLLELERQSADTPFDVSSRVEDFIAR